MVIYEWADSGYLGTVIDPNADYVSYLAITT